MNPLKTAPTGSEPLHDSRQQVDATGNRLNKGRVQPGVARIEATTKIWPRTHLIAAYAMIWLIYFVKSIEDALIFGMDVHVTSSFSRHSTTPAVDVVAIIVGGLSFIPLAKLIDVWGRPQTLVLTVLVWVLGLIMMAACDRIETFAAAKVFDTVGSQGVSYCITIFIADTSSLLNRPLALAFAASPYMVTTWLGGRVLEAVLKGPGWRWGFGIWALVTPVFILPLAFLLFLNDRRAVEAGLIEKTSGGSGDDDDDGIMALRRRAWDYIIAVDLVGIVLFAAGMALFLLPFSLWSYQAEQWRSPLVICMLVVGASLLVLFVFWERFLAPVQFIPYRLLLDQTVFSAGLMFVFVFASWSVWHAYFYSMLLVVWDTGDTKATYITNIHSVGSCLAAVVMGAVVHRIGRFKWAATYFGLPVGILGLGLMIRFRQASPGSGGVGLVVMTQVLVAVAGGPLVVAGEMAMMAPSDHQHVAVIMATLNLFSSIGSAVGQTVSAAIWTGTFRQQLMSNLASSSSSSSDAFIDEIYADIHQQTLHPVGSHTRDAISRAYSQTQRSMLITSLSLLVFAWGCTWLWRDIKLSKIKQVSGTII